MGSPFDLLELDRQVAHATARLHHARRDRLADSPFQGLRRPSSKSTVEELRDLASDPIASALADHVARLTLDRVTLDDERRIETAWNAPTFGSTLFDRFASAREISSALLRESESDEKRARMGRELGDAARSAAEVLPIFVERRTEARKLLQIPSNPDWKTALALAERVLTLTEPALEVSKSRVGETWEGTLAQALARDAGEGWPAALRPRFVNQLCGRGTLTGGLRLDVGDIGTALGALSFCRALSRFGEAVARADLPRGVPFCLARSPTDPLPHARAALFASIPCEPSFSERVLGLSRGVAREQARRIAVGLALALRIEALRVIVSASMVGGLATDTGEATSARALGSPLPSALIGLLPRLALGPERFIGAIEGVVSRVTLRETFDQDWFENPRAHEALRDEHHRSWNDRAPPLTEADAARHDETRERVMGSEISAALASV